MSKKLPIIKNTKVHGHRSGRGDFFITSPSRLVLADGQIFSGVALSQQTESAIGEVVFNTGMTGYVESLTDPSYAGQILVFTYPLIGNYGVDLRTAESDKIQVRGVVVAQAAQHWSHASSSLSLTQWLASQYIPIIMGVDTRAVTKHLRTSGTMPGAIGAAQSDLKKVKLGTQFVTIDRPRTFGEPGLKKVILVDCGAKENIQRSLLDLPLQVKRVPYDYDFVHEAYDGVVLSNGPGDPTDYRSTIAITAKVLAANKPVMGICLGSQLMGLAAGAKTYKLKFGHRGHNQPCMEVANGHCVITSQNHGYAIDEHSLPPAWRVSFRNLNDASVEGIEHSSKPFFSVQFHPEACPGPTDTAWLFEKFLASL